VVDPAAFAWDADWRGRPWKECVLYELHVGSFTREGTFAAATERLQELADTGITAVELMPVAISPVNSAGATTACCPSRRTMPTVRRRT
jgi:1,4-alpha-glucan branching enzyme